MNLTEKTLGRQEIYNGKIIKVHVDTIELPDGGLAKREVVDHPGGVCIAALTEDNELLFVRQFRYPYSEEIWELPAGKLEPGDTPLENGKRELKEETGATGMGYVSLGKLYPSPGYCGEIIHLYFCRVSGIGDCSPDEDEFLEVKRIPLKEAVTMVLNNQIPDAKSQTAILKTSALLECGIL
ncbi:MAG: NUDIX hydrolase [Clostridiales bacterium]|jgi:ADP-ribose pyrophosphatase|nr:NUDIX hydrolase [Clostridiales bacterium]